MGKQFLCQPCRVMFHLLVVISICPLSYIKNNFKKPQVQEHTQTVLVTSPKHRSLHRVPAEDAIHCGQRVIAGSGHWDRVVLKASDGARLQADIWKHTHSADKDRQKQTPACWKVIKPQLVLQLQEKHISVALYSVWQWRPSFKRLIQCISIKTKKWVRTAAAPPFWKTEHWGNQQGNEGRLEETKLQLLFFIQ